MNTSIIVIIFSIVMAAPVTVFLHELGHAITALIVTSKEVTMYVGSYGEEEKASKWKFGRLKIYLKKPFLLWNTGLVDFEERAISTSKQALISAMGPLTSLILGVGVLVSFWSMNVPGEWRVFSFIYFVVSMADAFFNLRPSSKLIKLSSGAYTYNDGMALLFLWRHRKSPPEFYQAMTYMEAGEYEKTVGILKSLLNTDKKNRDYYRQITYALFQLKRSEEAMKYFKEFEKHFNLSTQDLQIEGALYFSFEEFDKAEKTYQRIIQEDAENFFGWYNRGLSLTRLHRHEEALESFERAELISPNDVYSQYGIGLATLNLKQTDEALLRFQKLMDRYPNHHLSHLGIGEYYVAIGEMEKAIGHLNKAKEIDPSIEIDDILQRASAS
ncbi:MAG: tetratricopeptide repeat protein [Flavobacteriia bacterium]|nr:tetratricopeptide repeat protein [Flavobacteriia bacterium]